MTKGVSVAVGSRVGIGVGMLVGVSVNSGIADGCCVIGRGVDVWVGGIELTATDSIVGVETIEVAVQPTKARIIPTTSTYTFSTIKNLSFFIFTLFGR